MDENAIDWQGLVDKALGDADTPPNPVALINRVYAWNAWFNFRYGGDAVFPVDYPEPLQRFYKLLETVPAKRGRPRCDQAVLVAARKAWVRHNILWLYEQNKVWFGALGRQEGATVSDYDKTSLKTEFPSRLAMENIADIYGYSIEYVRDIIHPRRRKKK